MAIFTSSPPKPPQNAVQAAGDQATQAGIKTTEGALTIGGVSLATVALCVSWFTGLDLTQAQQGALFWGAVGLVTVYMICRTAVKIAASRVVNTAAQTMDPAALPIAEGYADARAYVGPAGKRWLVTPAKDASQ